MTPRFASAARAAAARHGTPAYLYDLERLRTDAAAVCEAFPDPWIRLYSLKANGLPRLVREAAASGLGANAVSGGELALAARAGIAPARTALEGIGKTDADLARAVDLAARGTPLLWVSLESTDDAAALAAIARAKLPRRTRLDVLVRLNPAVRPETHHGLAVGAPGSKFGVTADELPAVVDAGGGANGPLRWRGLHLHVGSQLGAIDAWRSGIRLGLATLHLQRAGLPDFDTLDVGSGFPVTADDAASPSVAAFADAARAALQELPPGTAPARLAVEPGRAVVARSGWILARVLHARVRESAQVVLDAGMTELIRPALYGAVHPIVALTSLGTDVAEPGIGDRPEGAESTALSVHGPVCESSDLFGEHQLPPLRRGDLVAIGLAGAYASAMASTYNGRARAVELAWDGERTTVLRRRGSFTALP